MVDTFSSGVARGRVAAAPTLDAIRRAVDAMPPPQRQRWGWAAWESTDRLIDDLLRVAQRLGTLNIGASAAAREREVYFAWTSIGLGAWLHPSDFQLLRTVLSFDDWMRREEAALVRR